MTRIKKVTQSIPSSGLVLNEYADSETDTYSTAYVNDQLDEKQGTLTAGAGITIDQATGTISATDTTYSDFTGTDGTSAGTAGLVPAPATTDAGKFLKADGTWDSAGGGTLYTTTGTNTDGAMTQLATSNLIYPSGAETSQDRFAIGSGARATQSGSISIGVNTGCSTSSSTDFINIGHQDNYATGNRRGSIFIGTDSVAKNKERQRGVFISPNGYSCGYGVTIGYNARAGDPNADSVGDIAIGPDAKAVSNKTSYNTTIGGGGDQYSVAVGLNAGSSSVVTGMTAVGALAGQGYSALGNYTTMLGSATLCSANYSVALGSHSNSGRASEVAVGDGSSNANYGTRYIANVRDPQKAQDAATKNYVDGTVLYSDSTGTAGNVTLSESASNFRKLEITYIRRNRTFMATVANSGDVAVFGGWTGSYEESGSTIYQADFEIENMNINGTTITRQSRIGLYGDSTTGGNFSVSGGNILNVITKVVGYK